MPPTWFKTVWISLVLLVIVLPAEEKTKCIGIRFERSHLTIQTTVSLDELSEPEIADSDESATFARNRCDFLDLLLGSYTGQISARTFVFQKKFFSYANIPQFLLSDLLLSLPPPSIG